MSSIICVAGGTDGTKGIIAYSYDGNTWTASSSASSIFSSGYISGIASSSTTLVAVGTNGKIAYSNTVHSWNEASLTTANANGFASVAYGNGLFIAVGRADSQPLWYSSDGINWSASSYNLPKTATSITYISSISMWIVTINPAGQNTGIFSNSVNPITISNIGTTNNFGGMGWGFWFAKNGATYGIDYLPSATRYVLVGSFVPAIGCITYTTNATTPNNNYTAAISNGAAPFTGVKCNGSMFVVVGTGTNPTYYSTDGINWTASSSSIVNSANNYCVNFGNGMWFIGGAVKSNNCIYKSSNGISWTAASNNPFGTSAGATVYSISVAGFSSMIGSAPTITSITNTSSSFSVYFNPSSGAIPPPSTYYYSLNGGNTYTNANSTTSPILISGVPAGINYRIALIANNSAGNTVSSNISIGFIPYPCFLQGTKILRMNQETDDEEYVAVETLRRGDLIKTVSHGYKAIELIGSRKITNPLDVSKKSSRLYWLRKSKISGMREDLCLTGDHCILHKNITDKKKEEVFEYMGDLYVTEGHYRVPAFLDERAEPYESSEPATIWHFALEHNNIYHNYGVMANGLLVESSSLHYMYKYSNMEMV